MLILTFKSFLAFSRHGSKLLAYTRYILCVRVLASVSHLPRKSLKTVNVCGREGRGMDGN